MQKRHLSVVGAPAAPTGAALLESLSDEALLAEFRVGSDEAFAALYRRYQARILSYLRGMISNQELADEVYNATLYRIYSRLPEQLAPGQFRRYLYRAAHNGCLNACRKERNLSRRPPEGRGWGGMLHNEREDIDPEERLASGQLLVLARDYLDALPEDRRAALLLYHNDGLTYQEIADVLDRPIGTVRWLIHEARAAMARHLDRHLRARD